MKIEITRSSVDAAVTGQLRQVTKLRAKNDGAPESAVLSAGYYARKLGREVFVYRGNSYGHVVWRVSYKPSEYLNRINNDGALMFSVTPDLTVTRHDLARGQEAPAESDMQDFYVRGANKRTVRGPWRREQAFTFAQAGSQKGQSPRDVWLGIPDGATSRLLRRYEQGATTFRAT